MLNMVIDMTHQGATVAIPNATGLHARPAASFVQLAKKFKSQVTLHKADQSVNGKSVVSILGLETQQGDLLHVVANGEDAQAAIQALTEMLASGCGELPQRCDQTPAQGDDHQSLPKTAESPVYLGNSTPVGAFVGVPAAQGIATGHVYRFVRTSLEVIELASASCAQELNSFHSALSAVKVELQTQSEGQSNEDTAGHIMAAHLTVLEDSELLDEIAQAVQGGKSAAFACQSVFELHAKKLEASSLEYLRSRAMDLRDIGRRLVNTLLGVVQTMHDIPTNSVVVAYDLSPSEIVEFDLSKVVGLVTVQGGANSHVAILAKSFGIPLLCGVSDDVLKLASGTPVILDAMQAWLLPEPNAEMQSQALARLTDRRDLQRHQLAHAQTDAVTFDGLRVEVVANIRNEQDAFQAIQWGAEGVGLLRSEFLFTDRSTAPSEAEQAAVYLAVARVLGVNRPLVIRTLDVGGDKPLRYLPLPAEENPFLGVRGVRVSLMHPELFRAQLRAILKAAPETQLHIMFPMVSDLEELRQIKAILGEEQALMTERSIQKVRVGVMIEVPSAALMVEHLAAEVDFFSIGTNDLTQYTLAMDRGHPQFGLKADSLHPAVLKMIEITCTGALKHGKWVGVCGGLAGNPLAVPLLVGLGVRELSVDAPSIPSVKASVRAHSVAACQALAKEVLNLSTTGAVIQHLKKFQSNN